MRQTIALAFVFVGIASLILFTSTDVFTLFARQHTFVNISSTGNDISCVDCHHRIQNELNNSAFHNDLSCEDCHRFTGRGITFASGDEASATPGKEAHAAYTPRCLDCHEGSGVDIVNKTGQTVHAPPAPAFNESGYGTNYSAHKPFVEDSLNYNLSVGENEACIACHTNYSIRIDYSYFWNIEYQTGEDGGKHDWEFTSPPTPNGTRYYNITFSKTGAKHEFINTDDIDCTECHKNIYDALVNGTSGTPPYLTHAPIEIASNWDSDNPWNHYRYHYIPSSSRAEWVNNSYCYKCHNVKKYADENPSDNTTYDLGNVTSDTNSTEVHAAEALWCQTCHGSGKTKEVIDNPDQSHPGHAGRSFVDDIASNYARTFHGDICMGCHEAAVHPSSGECGRCHEHGRANVDIQSEPSGYATNT